ncbi:MAG: RecX family transcriptional regulator, partial [Clostridia bacterium]|nr:RecX family transcriptional regulator [Clostridia bacterium]
GISSALREKYCVMENGVSHESAQKLADKYMKNKPTDLKTLQKLQRYLVGRGYDFDVVNAIVKKYRFDE